MSLFRLSVPMMPLLLLGAAHATPPGNFEAIPPGQADLDGAVGPDELRDFTIGDEPDQEPSAPSPTQPTPSRPQSPAEQPRAVPEPSRPVAPATASPTSERETATDTAESLSPAAPSGPASTLPAESGGDTSVIPPPAATIAPGRLPGDAMSEESALWPWAIALLALAGAGALYWRRRRPSLAAAGQPHDSSEQHEPDIGERETSERDASPPPLPPVPDAGEGLVTVKAAPKLELAFQPLRASLSGTELVIEYALLIANRGNAAAQDVGVDVTMVMAGPGQEDRIAQFTAHPPVERTIAVAALLPYGQCRLSGAVRLTGEELTAIEMDGRKLLLPTLVFLPRHKSGAGSAWRFVVGRKPKEGEKLAPMRADLGPRVWRDLEARKA